MCGSGVHTKTDPLVGWNLSTRDRFQKVADSVTQSAGFVWTEGRSDNSSFRIQAIQVPRGRALKIHQVLFSQAAQISHREVSCFWSMQKWIHAYVTSWGKPCATLKVPHATREQASLQDLNGKFDAIFILKKCLCNVCLHENSMNFWIKSGFNLCFVWNLLFIDLFKR